MLTAAEPRWLGCHPGIGRALPASGRTKGRPGYRMTPCGIDSDYVAGVAGGAEVAQRMAWTGARPAGGTTAASGTGSRGGRGGRRAHPGRSDTPAPAGTPYGGRADAGGGRGGTGG